MILPHNNVLIPLPVALGDEGKASSNSLDFLSLRLTIGLVNEWLGLSN